MTELYFRQLLAGRDFASTDPVARQMVNFSYLVGDRSTGQCVVVDPAYDVAGLVGLAAADDMSITGALVTHYHADHCGGDLMGYPVEGIERLLDLDPVPIHIQRDELPWITRTTSCTEADFAVHDSGERVTVGGIDIELIATPGHTPGSQCFLVSDRLVAGDTLFLEGCGRTDLPGGDPEQLYYSLTQRLAKVPDTAVLYPGHLYSSEPSAPMGETRRHNFVFKPGSVEQWMTMFGPG
ncbi:MAG: MBL fold metallo-hydrolase [Microthrixaceae bacterium]